MNILKVIFAEIETGIGENPITPTPATNPKLNLKLQNQKYE